MKKIIASSDQKDPILRKLSSQNHGIVTDTQIIPLSTFLKEEKDDDLVLSIQLSNKLLLFIFHLYFIIYINIHN